MMPGNYPLPLYHGDSYEWQFKLWLDEGKTVPLDLTDVIPKAEIRDKPGGANIYALSCSILEPNIVWVSLSATLCATIPVGNLVWDLQLTYPSGAVNTILAGAVTMAPDVTDSTVVAGVFRAPRAVTK
jgi:hypothetical protein